jgi:hypothetical protein
MEQDSRIVPPHFNETICRPTNRLQPTLRGGRENLVVNFKVWLRAPLKAAEACR